MVMMDDELYDTIDYDKFPFKQLYIGDSENLEIKK